MTSKFLDMKEMREIAGGSVTVVKKIELGEWTIIQTTLYPTPIAGAENKPIVTYEVLPPRGS